MSGSPHQATQYYECFDASSVAQNLTALWSSKTLSRKLHYSLWIYYSKEVSLNDLLQMQLYCHDLGVTIDVLWIGEWIHSPLIHSFGTTSNYSAIANLHTLQSTTATAKSLPAVPWQRLLTVGILQLHALRFWSSRRPVQNSIDNYQLNYSAISSQLPLQSSTDRLPQFSSFYNSSARCVRKDCRGNVFTEPLPRN
jgi:hypothetical protein